MIKKETIEEYVTLLSFEIDKSGLAQYKSILRNFAKELKRVKLDNTLSIDNKGFNKSLNSAAKESANFIKKSNKAVSKGFKEVVSSNRAVYESLKLAASKARSQSVPASKALKAKATAQQDNVQAAFKPENKKLALTLGMLDDSVRAKLKQHAKETSKLKSLYEQLSQTQDRMGKPAWAYGNNSNVKEKKKNKNIRRVPGYTKFGKVDPGIDGFGKSESLLNKLKNKAKSTFKTIASSGKFSSKNVANNFEYSSKSIINDLKKVRNVALQVKAAAAGIVIGASVSGSIIRREKFLADSVDADMLTMKALGNEAELLGLDYERVIDLVEEMNNKVGESKDIEVMSSVKDAMKMLELDFNKLKEMPTGKQFEVVIDAALRAENAQSAVSAVDMLMGGEANKITGLLRKRYASLSEVVSNYKSLSFTDKESIDNAVAYSMATKDLTTIFKSLNVLFTGSLGKHLKNIADDTKAWLKTNKEVVSSNISTFTSLLGASFQTLAFAVKLIIAPFTMLAKILHTNEAAVVALAAAMWVLKNNPIVLVITALLAVLEDLYTSLSGGDGYFRDFYNFFKHITSSVDNFVGAVKSAVEWVDKLLSKIPGFNGVKSFVKGIFVSEGDGKGSEEKHIERRLSHLSRVEKSIEKQISVHKQGLKKDGMFNNKGYHERRIKQLNERKSKVKNEIKNKTLELRLINERKIERKVEKELRNSVSSSIVNEIMRIDNESYTSPNMDNVSISKLASVDMSALKNIENRSNVINIGDYRSTLKSKDDGLDINKGSNLSNVYSIDNGSVVANNPVSSLVGETSSIANAYTKSQGGNIKIEMNMPVKIESAATPEASARVIHSSADTMLRTANAAAASARGAGS